MKKFLGFWLLAAVFAAGCGKMGYRYAKSGMKYKIISGGGKDTLKQGDMIKLFIEQRIEDSVLVSSREAGHQMVNFDTGWAKQEYFVTEVIPQMKVGDSVVCIMKTDTIISKFYKNAPPDAIPPFMKKGTTFYIYARIVKKYTDTAEFRKDAQAEAVLAEAFQRKSQEKMMAERKKKDEEGFAKSRAELDKFLGNRKNTLLKTPRGVYVEITEPGTGTACDSGKQVDIRYKGTLLDGTEFDTNMEKPGDSIKKPAYSLIIGQPGAIEGFSEGIKTLRKGSRANLYIPAELGWGSQGSGDKIKPYNNVMFNVYIEDVSQPKKQAAMPPPPPPPTEAPKEDHTGHNHK